MFIGLLKEGKAIRIKVKGRSMLPILRDGDTLTIAPIDWARIKVGDIVLYANRKNEWITHRVVRKAVNSLMTGADSKSFLDSPIIKKENVLGRVVKVDTGSKIIDLRAVKYRLHSLAMAYFLKYSGVHFIKVAKICIKKPYLVPVKIMRKILKCIPT